MPTMPVPPIEKPSEGPKENVFVRAGRWLNRHKGKILLGTLLALPVLRNLGVFASMGESAWAGVQTAGNVLEKGGKYIGQANSWLGGKAHDLILGKMENPATDNQAQRFYRGVEKVFGTIKQDTAGAFAPGPEKLPMPRPIKPGL